VVGGKTPSVAETFGHKRESGQNVSGNKERSPTGRKQRLCPPQQADGQCIRGRKGRGTEPRNLRGRGVRGRKKMARADPPGRSLVLIRNADTGGEKTRWKKTNLSRQRREEQVTLSISGGRNPSVPPLKGSGNQQKKSLGT